MAIQSQVELVRLPFCAEHFPDDCQPEYVGVEPFRDLVIGADNGNVVNVVEEGHGVWLIWLKIIENVSSSEETISPKTVCGEIIWIIA